MGWLTSKKKGGGGSGKTHIFCGPPKTIETEMVFGEDNTFLYTWYIKDVL